MPTMDATNAADPVIAAFQAFIASSNEPRGSLSHKSLSEELTSHQRLTLQIAHNLRFQHHWTELYVHHIIPGSRFRVLPCPILSGLPPLRLHIHPDEQMGIVQKQRNATKPGWPDLESPREREWVLPSHLQELWSVERFAALFDTLPVTPPDHNLGSSLQRAPWTQQGQSLQRDQELRADCSSSHASNTMDDPHPNPCRIQQPKRLLLATPKEGSIIAYYAIYDGFVEPGQAEANTHTSKASR